MHTIAGPYVWILFAVFVIAMLAIDLGVFHRRAHIVGAREALVWSGVWVSLAAIFGLGVYVFAGANPALEFATGYVIEKSLSIDNVFVFAVVFAAFEIPRTDQHRVLFWGILGALLMRGVFILMGVSLIEHFHFVMYVFGAILVLGAVKLLRDGHMKPFDKRKSRFYRVLQRVLPTTDGLRKHRFFVRENGRLLATPLFVVLLVLEMSDVVFAVDSIPAVFAITTDPFIVYTSNIFAILGLRSLYFVLSGALARFHHLRIGLAVILAFVGLKMLVADLFKIPTLVSLGVIVAVLVASIVASLYFPAHRRAAAH